ncbi:hypothetical protein [Streptomyces sp. NPDC018000]|uniref:DUF7507 domain-containing protein n=1 Tax=Streptomyces sp. NPDC018000 TaxID=3365028 RepID=UPI00379DD1B0
MALLASTLGLAVGLTSAPAQAANPTVTCTTSPNIFNTGYNAATGGVLPADAKDANWQVAGPFPATASVSPPPAGAAFAAANVGNLVPGWWAASPYGNAQWISQQTTTNPGQGVTNGDWYYRYQFDLSPSVSASAFALSMNFLADNAVAEVYVNGVAQSNQTTGLPQTTLTGPPPAGQQTGTYYYAGYETAKAAQTTLNHNWQTGLNTIDVLIKSGEALEGFDAQVRPSVLCPSPSVSVKKTADPQTVKAAGETITYSFVLTNTGNVELKDLAVKETSFSGTGTPPVAQCPDGPLAPGKSATCTATYTVTQEDIDAGSLENTATGTGILPDGGDPVESPPSEAKVSSPPEPDLTVVKSGKTEKPGELVVGEKVGYEFVVTNTGNVTLKDVKVIEGEFTGTGKLSDVVCPAEAGSLAPGASVTCKASYEVTQADVDAGSIKNSATSTGTPPGGTEPPVSPPSEVTVPAPSKPDLKVVKSATTEKPGELVVGEKVSYEFVVTNTGNVTLKDVKVIEGEFTGTGKLSDVVCPAEAASLAPGASVTCKASYEVTQADVDAGSIKNSATSTGTPPGGTEPPVSPPSEVTVPAPSKPDLKVVKSATTEKPGELVAGEKVSYEFVVTNTGNVTLKDVKVIEGEFTGTGKLSDVVCPAEAASLAPGASVTCKASYEVTQADVDAGSIKNSATSTGTPPGGTEPPVSPPSEVEVPAPSKPDLKVVKSGKTEKPGELVVGEKVSYEFAVTNTGNVTLKDVKVIEGEFTGTGKLSDVDCPDGAASLAPGASVTCKASYEVTQADVDAGSIENSATSTGTPPGGTESPVSPPSKVKVPANGEGRLDLVKTAKPVDVNRNGRTDLGDRIEWKLKVSNKGTRTVTDIKVSDPTAGQVTCPATSLAPGKSMDCTAPAHTITAKDVANGKVVNKATAFGKSGEKKVYSPEASSTVKIKPGDKPVGPLYPNGPGNPYVQSAGTYPTDHKSSGPLASTGTKGLTLLGIGGALLVAGGLVLGASRRRRRTN